MQTLDPLVSIIIPAYNQACYLRQSIDSVLAQTYKQFEVIVVDDGSTDETSSILTTYGSCIRYIHQENLGLGGARNSGIRVAQGEYIGLLDADDIWEPNYLDVISCLIAENPGASVFYCKAQCIDENGIKLPQYVGYPIKPLNTSTDLYRALLTSNFLIPSTTTIRRKIFLENGYFDQTLRSCQDWDLWLRISPNNSFVGTKDVLVQYRVHAQSLSANIRAQQASAKMVFENHFGPDDGQYDHWSPAKKLAYSGLYRYILISSILRQGDWQYGSKYLHKTLLIDPAKASDIDLFYELSIGRQPMGYRGSAEKMDIEANAQEVLNMLDDVFSSDDSEALQILKQQVYGTAYYSIGLSAYNTGNLKLSRPYLWLAGRLRPSLWFFTSLPNLLIKSLLGNKILEYLRPLKKT